MERRYGKDYAPAKLPYRQGDIVTTMIKTVKGNTIDITMDMQLPRPYDYRLAEVQGTRGLFSEQRNAVFLADVEGKPEQWEPFAPYQAKYDHSLWRSFPPGMITEQGELTGQQGVVGHGGIDVLVLHEFVRAVHAKTQTPIDVYDSVVMSVVVPLSAQSIAAGSTPVKCPDFTSGKWETTKPKFALDA